MLKDYFKILRCCVGFSEIDPVEKLDQPLLRAILAVDPMMREPDRRPSL
jgi:hypothetical protein